jgi:Dimethlysulfonioproprionate lyase
MSQLEQARALLQTPLGVAGSARLRYGAAMTLYQAGRINAEVLEVYRGCASLDAQDALALLAEYGLPNPVGPEVVIGALLAAIDGYLETLEGRGIADVRQGIAAVINTPIARQPCAPNPVVAQHLEAALHAAASTVPALANAIQLATPHLNWITYDGYDPDAIGAEFMRGHAYTTIIGAGGSIKAVDFDLGLFLIAPHVLYRDHHHAAPELYAPITGPHGWRFGVNAPLVIKPAHVTIWNDPFAPHLTKVGPVPFLCIFGWPRDVAAAAQVIPAKDWAALDALRIEGAHAK